MAPDPSPPAPDDPTSATASSRRRFLKVGGLSAIGLALAACSSDPTVGSGSDTTAAAAGSSSTTRPRSAVGTTSEAPATDRSGGTDDTGGTAPLDAATPLTPADFAGLATCVLLPEKTAGPFPLDEQLDRRDITEGYEGQPMRLGLRVVDDACVAVPGAKVEIWHTDATGDYSAFTDGGGGKDEAEGTTFLRGTQSADDDGIVEFLTIVPGWYRGRAVHIHLRVHLDDATVLTSQMFFDPAFLEAVYATGPYAEFGLPDTSNESDGIAGDAEAEGTILVTSSADTANGAGTLALLNIGIDPTATSGGDRAGGPGGGGPGGGGPGGPPGGGPGR